MSEENLPEVTRAGVLSMQVCVPSAFTDDDVITFAEKEFPCGTSAGWQIRRAGDPSLSGCDERVACEKRSGCVHIMLDA